MSNGSFFSIYDQIFNGMNILDNSIIVFKDDVPKYIKKRGQGIVFYTKPKNEYKDAHVKHVFNRRITPKRVFTHIRK